MRPLSPLLLCLTLITATDRTAACQATDVPSISTDRPSVGTGPDLVPVGYLQIESGLTWNRADQESTVDAPESLLRLGISRRLEAQILTPNLRRSGAYSGVRRSDTALGAKWNVLSSARSWPLTVVTTMTLPTGSSALSSGGVDPAVLLTTGHMLPHRLQLLTSASLSLVSQAHNPRSWNSQYAVILERGVGQRAGLFLESAPFTSTAADGSGVTMDSGMTWTPSRQVQFDWRAGATLQSGGETFFVSFGYSRRRNLKAQP